jgi:hypothetical protein
MKAEKDLPTVAAYLALGIWTFATVVVGAIYYFASNGERFQPWLLPMCVLTVFGAVLVGRFVKSRRSVQNQ